MTFFPPAVLCTVIICYTLIHVVGELLEQRRRETKTGEFEGGDDE